MDDNILLISCKWKLAYLDSSLYKENWNKIRLMTTYDVQKWKSVKDILVRVRYGDGWQIFANLFQMKTCIPW